MRRYKKVACENARVYACVRKVHHKVAGKGAKPHVKKRAANPAYVEIVGNKVTRRNKYSYEIAEDIEPFAAEYAGNGSADEKGNRPEKGIVINNAARFFYVADIGKFFHCVHNKPPLGGSPFKNRNNYIYILPQKVLFRNRYIYVFKKYRL